MILLAKDDVGYRSVLALTTAAHLDGYYPKFADQTGRGLVSLAEQLDPMSEVDLAHHGKVHRYPKRFLLAGAVEHGVRHRTEVSVNPASIGLPTPDLDGWAYGRSAGYGAKV